MNKNIVILLLLMLGVTFASCTKNEEEPKQKEEVKKFDPQTIMYINGNSATKAMDKEAIDHVLEYTCSTHSISDGQEGNYGCCGNGEFYNEGRDFENQRFMFCGEQVIYSYDPNNLELGWLVMDNKDFVFVCYIDKDGNHLKPDSWENIDKAQKFGVYDTIAYIPNKVIQDLKVKMTKAFDEKNYDECYRIFKEEYIFVPCNGGAEWRKLEGKDKVTE